jgi:translation elongation factor EF-4
LNILNGESTILRLWDTPGTEYSTVTPANFFRDADICVGVFSFLDPETYEILKQQISNHEKAEGPFRALAIVESLSDLIRDEKIEEEKRKLADIETETGRKTFLVSSKEGTGVDELMQWIIENVGHIQKGEELTKEKSVEVGRNGGESGSGCC